jgi:hypothetical protein
MLGEAPTPFANRVAINSQAVAPTLLRLPSAQAGVIRARTAKACAVLRRDTRGAARGASARLITFDTTSEDGNITSRSHGR